MAQAEELAQLEQLKPEMDEVDEYDQLLTGRIQRNKKHKPSESPACSSIPGQRDCWRWWQSLSGWRVRWPRRDIRMCVIRKHRCRWNATGGIGMRLTIAVGMHRFLD